MTDLKTSAEPVTITTIGATDLLRVSTDLGGGTFGNAKFSGGSLLAQLAAANKAWTTITGVPANITNAISSLTGDGTAAGPGAAAFTLAASGVAAGTYGDATHVAQVTFDAKGRATGVTNVLITASGSGLNQLTGDVAAGPGTGSQVATIQPNVVDNTKLATMAAATIKGSVAGGNAADLTGAQVAAIAAPFIRGLRNTYQSGNVHVSPGLSTTPSAYVANIVYYTPVPLWGDTIAASMVLRVTTAGAGVAVVGMYADVGGRPSGNPLGQTAAFSVNSIALMNPALLSATALANMQAVWLAYHTNITASLQNNTSSVAITILGRSTFADFFTSTNLLSWTQSATYTGTLPAVGTLAAATGNFPALGFVDQ